MAATIKNIYLINLNVRIILTAFNRAVQLQATRCHALSYYASTSVHQENTKCDFFCPFGKYPRFDRIRLASTELQDAFVAQVEDCELCTQSVTLET